MRRRSSAPYIYHMILASLPANTRRLPRLLAYARSRLGPHPAHPPQFPHRPTSSPRHYHPHPSPPPDSRGPGPSTRRPRSHSRALPTADSRRGVASPPQYPRERRPASPTARSGAAAHLPAAYATDLPEPPETSLPAGAGASAAVAGGGRQRQHALPSAGAGRARRHRAGRPLRGLGRPAGAREPLPRSRRLLREAPRIAEAAHDLPAVDWRLPGRLQAARGGRPGCSLDPHRGGPVGHLRGRSRSRQAPRRGGPRGASRGP